MRAVMEIGLGQATMKAVAEQLGVSVPGLYHHVRGKEDLLRLAAQHSVTEFQLPVDRGQPWWKWLADWARYVRSSLSSEPELLAQYVSGAIRVDQMNTTLERVVDVLHREGFDTDEALGAFDAISYYAVGAAAREVRERAAVVHGRGFVEDLARSVGDDTEEYPWLVDYLATRPVLDLDRVFEEELTTVLAGIAARRGESWAEVAQERGTRSQG